VEKEGNGKSERDEGIDGEQEMGLCSVSVFKMGG